jgi:peptide/nickel transport system permease protein
MSRYVVHRLLVMIPTLIAISIVVFTIINLPPGNYFTTYIAQLQASGQKADLVRIHFLEQEYGFDRPLWQQYLSLQRAGRSGRR